MLSNAAGVTAIVPTANIITGELPIKTALPAISIRHISATRLLFVKQPAAGKVLVTERVQVTAAAKDYATQQRVMAAVGAALPYTKGSVAGFVVDGISPDSDGPDVQDFVATIFEGSRDFLVRYFE
jgi:hypothetical protein